MSKDTITLTDNRTGKSYEIPIEYGTYHLYGSAIRAGDLRQVKVSENDFGLATYDPAFMNTASCRSKVTFIDGDKGILRYRGYPIDEVAEKKTLLRGASLLLFGELPTRVQLDDWVWNIT